MSGRHCISLSALDRRVSIPAYIAAVRRAIAAPDATFRQGLESWWPVTGAEIRREYNRALNRRIMRHAPHYGRGRKWSDDWQRAARQTANRVNMPRLIVRDSEVHPPELRRRLAHRITRPEEF